MRTLIIISLLSIFFIFFDACRSPIMTPMPPATKIKSEPQNQTLPSQQNTSGGSSSILNQNVLVIQGIFAPSGEKLLELKPIHRYSRRSEPASAPRTGPFVVEIAYTTGDTTSVSFDARVADDSYPGKTRYGFFEVTVPVSGEILSLRITDSNGKKIYREVNGTEILP